MARFSRRHGPIHLYGKSGCLVKVRGSVYAARRMRAAVMGDGLNPLTLR